MFDPIQIRKDFPALAQLRNNKPPIYFDSACTSLKPQSVIDAVTQYYTEYTGCAGRSDHWFAEKTQQLVQDARSHIATYINAKKKEEIVFTANTTAAINLLAYQFSQKGGVVITSDKEHNSNFLPWLRLAQQDQIKLEIIPTDIETGKLTLELFEDCLNKHAHNEGIKLVTVHHTSNFDGSTQDISALSRLAHKYGFYLHLDAAQSIPHTPLDVQKEDIDFLSFSGHKVLGPTGTGVFYGKTPLLETFEPLVIGGGTPLDVTYDSMQLAYPPQRFEAGIQHYAGIIGLGAAINYLTNVLQDDTTQILSHGQELNAYLTTGITGLSERIQIIGPKESADRPTILSFTLNGMHHQQVAHLLNERNNIMVRAGRHCVHAYCNAHAIAGTVRLSFYMYNTKEECDLFLNTLSEIVKI